jgi:hypothetical protein
MHRLMTTGQGSSPALRQTTAGLVGQADTGINALRANQSRQISRPVSRVAAPQRALSRLTDFSVSSQQQPNSLADQSQRRFSVCNRDFGDGRDPKKGVLNVFNEIRYGSDEISHAISKCSSFQTFHLGQMPLLPTLAVQKRSLHLYRSYGTACRSIYSQSYSGGHALARSIFTPTTIIDWRCFFTASSKNNGGGQQASASEAPDKISISATTAENNKKLSGPFAPSSGKDKSDESGLSLARIKNSINIGMTWMAQAVINFIMKAPGVIFYYLTHPKALKEKLGEWKDLAKKEANHYWMGMKVKFLLCS